MPTTTAGVTITRTSVNKIINTISKAKTHNKGSVVTTMVSITTTDKTIIGIITTTTAAVTVTTGEATAAAMVTGDKTIIPTEDKTTTMTTEATAYMC